VISKWERFFALYSFSLSFFLSFFLSKYPYLFVSIFFVFYLKEYSIFLQKLVCYTFVSNDSDVCCSSCKSTMSCLFESCSTSTELISISSNATNECWSAVLLRERCGVLALDDGNERAEEWPNETVVDFLLAFFASSSAYKKR
jgi:hypothetical protein